MQGCNRSPGEGGRNLPVEAFETQLERALEGLMLPIHPLGAGGWTRELPSTSTSVFPRLMG